MVQTLTERVEAILNTPGTGEAAQIAELNTNFTKLDNHFIPMCMIENTAVQSIPSGGLQPLQYNVTLVDSYSTRPEGAMADLANDRIVCRRDGLYHVEAKIWTTTPSAAGVMSLGLYVNGAGVAMDQFTPGNNSCTHRVSDDILLADGDLITCQAIQTSGAPRNYTRNTWPHGFTLSATWIGAVVEV